jgi:hypothetical protein
MCTANRGPGIGGLLQNVQQQKTAAMSSPTFGGKVSGGLAAAQAHTRPITAALFGQNRPPAASQPNQQPQAGVNYQAQLSSIANQRRWMEQQMQSVQAAQQTQWAQLSSGLANQQRWMEQQMQSGQAAQQMQAAAKAPRAAAQASAQVLGSVGAKQAPTATQSKKRNPRSSAANTPGSSLRIGSTGNAAGSGPNLPV